MLVVWTLLLAAVSCLAAAADLPTALAALEAGRIEEAAGILRELVRERPGDPQANYYLGVAHLRAGRLAESSRFFGKACELAPKDPDNCYFHGRSLFQQGRYAEAQKPFEQAIRNATPAARARVHRAAALNFLGLNQSEKAETHFREALRAYSGNSRPEEDPRIDYGSFLVREGRAADGLPVLQEAAQANPASARAHSELGRALLDLGDPATAAQRLEKSVTLDPAAWATRLLLGRAYLQLGRAEDAERELRLGRQGWSGHKP
jgi:Flp pilus assembly protein TadD